MNTLVIAAHPDDEVLGCGGTIARLASEGHRLSILILADGMTSRLEYNPMRDAEMLRLHHERAKRAGSLLGAMEVTLGSMPDQKMDTLPLLEVTQLIEREIARVQPEIVFTQHGGDLNMDHVITYRATLTATRPIPGSRIRRVYAYEVASSSEWSFDRFSPRFQPNVFFDVGTFIDTKIEAMRVYESEVRPFPHPRSAEAILANARHWGSVVGAQAAEAFEVVREII